MDESVSIPSIYETASHKNLLSYIGILYELLRSLDNSRAKIDVAARNRPRAVCVILRMGM